MALAAPVASVVPVVTEEASVEDSEVALAPVASVVALVTLAAGQEVRHSAEALEVQHRTVHLALAHTV